MRYIFYAFARWAANREDTKRPSATYCNASGLPWRLGGGGGGGGGGGDKRAFAVGGAYPPQAGAQLAFGGDASFGGAAFGAPIPCPAALPYSS
jgi:hypothetical protein